jgi:hypothetical protein
MVGAGGTSAKKVFFLLFVVGLGCGFPRRESFRSGSARLGRSQKDGLPSRSWKDVSYGFKAINSRTGKGQPDRCPFQSGAEMDAKTRDSLILLAALSLICASVAWSADRAVFAFVFFALGTVAALHAAPPRPRS